MFITNIRRRLEPLFEEDTDSCDSNNENCLLTNDKQVGYL